MGVDEHSGLVDPARAAMVATWWPDDDDAYLALTLRVAGRWDEDRFRAMLRSADALLDVLERAVDGDDAGDPAALDVPAIESEARTLVTLMAHPGFRSENDLGLTRAAYDAFLDERSAALLALAGRRRALLARAVAPSTGPDLALSPSPVPSPDQEPR
ncbi:hypothetical protein Cfla_1399 [Cellulomonas flavigena DSM 20109]|uniref:Uncharacterized protein n=1 Tax=Cellulomonas flavigena (strain ATCC 482 / DSM 20109 / BCRC 11376 / JCM 18109 / NBRC 3775 / NCIMB 8073 / NRS 134) TaxID=446466 RepID=D5UCI3_CELFN|nr:hypothetical protein [Cellulomonas flavigena]ADG74297.1 hypothetical protein Cfla_1399 [Cellulomonas flavigena DSM 20109]